MQKIEKQILITKDINSVWNVINLDFRSYQLIYPKMVSIEELEMTSDIIGSTYAIKYIFKEKELNGKIIILDWNDAPDSKIIEIEYIVNRKFKNIERFEIGHFAEDKEQTILKYTSTLTLTSFVDKIFDMFEFDQDKKVMSHLEKIKEVVEEQ